MTLSLSEAQPAAAPVGRLITRVALFWAFTYVLLTIRGAIFHDDWSRLIDNNRLLAVSVAPGAYAMVLRQLAAGQRVTLKGAMVWIAGATLAVMIVRVTVDELMFDVPQGVGVNLLWSLTWSAYFAIWVMGSLAFSQRTATVAAEQSDIVAMPAERESLELLITALLAEADTLKGADRARLTAKVLELGGYETAEAGNQIENERARLAIRLAARLSR